MKLIFAVLFLVQLLYSDGIDLIKRENNDSNTTLLIIGGIHGNEPGGYFAPSILISHYQILSKNVWIVPNLNKASIMAYKRGIHGDMNRKFASIKKYDKDKKIVEGIKKIILNPQVSLILNLHDGHGFYRRKYDSTVFNPNAWGQTCVIDQCKLETKKEFGELDKIASRVTKHVNSKLLHKKHKFDVRNTKTKFDDEAMQLSLTYFAVTHDKPAFAIETSKNLSSVSQKVYYQLLAIEEFMNIMGIKYKRDFDLREKEIKKILRQYGKVTINNNISFNLNDIKSYLSYVPLKSSHNDFVFTHPLGSMAKKKGVYVIYIGNKKIAWLKPQYFQLAKDCPESFKFEVDSKEVLVPKTAQLDVTKSFKVLPVKGLRANIIGYYAKGHKDESGFKVTYNSLNKKFSIDKNKKTFRIEFYKDNKFCSMTTVHFK